MSTRFESKIYSEMLSRVDKTSIITVVVRLLKFFFYYCLLLHIFVSVLMSVCRIRELSAFINILDYYLILHVIIWKFGVMVLTIWIV